MDRTEALNSLKTALIDGKDEGIDAAIDGCISVGMEFREIINAIQEDMCEVGVMFEKGRLFLPQMMVVAAGAQHAMDVIKPLIQQADSVGQGPRSVAMGSVLGDVHDIGKNICVVLMTSSGYQVRDLGRDVPVERFVDAVRDGVSFCGMSSLMTTTMLCSKEVIDALVSEGIRDGVVVMLGGAPVTQAFADKIGADIYGETAFETLTKMKSGDCLR